MTNWGWDLADAMPESPLSLTGTVGAWCHPAPCHPHWERDPSPKSSSFSALHQRGPVLEIPPSAYTSPGCIKGLEYVCSWGFSWVNPCVGGGPTQVHRPPWSPPAAPLGASRRCPVLALSCYPGRGQAAGVRAGAAPGGEGVVIKGFGLNDIIELDKGRIFL